MLPAGIPPMKAILEFNLPEEQHEHQDALQGPEWKYAVSELSGYLRGQIKHADHTAEEYRMLEAVHERLYKILEDRGLDLY